MSTTSHVTFFLWEHLRSTLSENVKCSHALLNDGDTFWEMCCQAIPLLCNVPETLTYRDGTASHTPGRGTEPAGPGLQACTARDCTKPHEVKSNTRESDATKGQGAREGTRLRPAERLTALRRPVWVWGKEATLKPWQKLQHGKHLNQ